MIECPQLTVHAGALLVKLRHAVNSPEDAKNVGVNSPEAIGALYDETRKAIDAAMLDLRRFGVLDMEWGPGLFHFKAAKEAFSGDDAWVYLLCAHNCFREVLDKYNIANPTNDQIAKIIAYGNWR